MEARYATMYLDVSDVYWDKTSLKLVTKGTMRGLFQQPSAKGSRGSTVRHGDEQQVGCRASGKGGCGERWALTGAGSQGRCRVGQSFFLFCFKARMGVRVHKDTAVCRAHTTDSGDACLGLARGVA